jgi:hypothetical protein
MLTDKRLEKVVDFLLNSTSGTVEFQGRRGRTSPRRPLLLSRQTSFPGC